MDVMIEAAKHQLLPLYDEITLPAMQAFGLKPSPEPLIAAIFGAMIAAMFLYVAGMGAAQRMQRKNPERYAELSKKLAPTLLLTLLVIGSPFGFVLAFMAGYVRTKAGLSVAAALLGLGAHYGLTYG